MLLYSYSARCVLGSTEFEKTFIRQLSRHLVIGDPNCASNVTHVAHPAGQLPKVHELVKCQLMKKYYDLFIYEYMSLVSGPLIGWFVHS